MQRGTNEEAYLIKDLDDCKGLILLKGGDCGQGARRGGGVTEEHHNANFESK